MFGDGLDKRWQTPSCCDSGNRPENNQESIRVDQVNNYKGCIWFGFICLSKWWGFRILFLTITSICLDFVNSSGVCTVFDQGSVALLTSTGVPLPPWHVVSSRESFWSYIPVHLWLVWLMYGLSSARELICVSWDTTNPPKKALAITTISMWFLLAWTRRFKLDLRAGHVGCTVRVFCESLARLLALRTALLLCRDGFTTLDRTKVSLKPLDGRPSCHFTGICGLW